MAVVVKTGQAWAFFRILKSYRPGLFFGIIAGFLAISSILFGLPAVIDYFRYRYVYHVPLALLATGLAILSAMSASIGQILQTQLRYHNELFNILRREHFSRSDLVCNKPKT